MHTFIPVVFEDLIFEFLSVLTKVQSTSQTNKLSSSVTTVSTVAFPRRECNGQILIVTL